MRTSCPRRFIPMLLTLCFASLAFSPAVQAAAFAKFEGIKGESKESNHVDWINVISISESISRPGSGVAGSSRERGTAVFNDIVLTKEIDRSSVTLRQMLAQGANIPKLEIELTRNSGKGGQETYFRYELENVQITSFQFNASGDESAPATESVSVAFEKIEWTYTLFDETGGKQGTEQAGWDISKGTSQ